MNNEDLIIDGHHVTREYMNKKFAEVWNEYKDSNWMKMLSDEDGYISDEELYNEYMKNADKSAFSEQASVD